MGWMRRRTAGRAAEAAATTEPVSRSFAVPPPSPEAAVIFTVTEAQLREMTVEAGPCVPAPGGKEPLVPPGLQQYGESPQQTAALFTALTGRSAGDVLALVEAKAPGTLMRFSEEFVTAMADANRLHLRLAEEDQHHGGDELTRFGAARRELDAAWMAAGDWPAERVGTLNKLTRLREARDAQEQGRDLYVWYGPSVVEYVIITGRS